MTSLTPADVAAAADRIAPYARRTPAIRIEVDGRPLLLKLEYLQRSGSFKLRGALNALLMARPDSVVTASGGNHGLAVATAAAILGIPATVFVPETVPFAKARRIEAAGARLVRHGTTYAEAAAAAVAEPGHYVHAYDDPTVVPGQGTSALEVIADFPEVEAFYVAVGGGGLAAGTSLAIGDRRTVAVEPENCCALFRALAAGKPVDSPVDSVASSALGATRAGELPFAILNNDRTSSVLVSDKEMLEARDFLWEEARIAAEPAAAAPFAAWRDARTTEFSCVIVCGANTDWHPQD
ncbi:serine/threonine dehydratase [Fodinicola acaciae]|uniref:serine/threonine dehydratase n=1 Tax=Fodinicola acaciae TaxID=2681555 RepID=UPI0013D18CC7|nr:serine/threonine dehydratase [Fodinicola acaciae]